MKSATNHRQWGNWPSREEGIAYDLGYVGPDDVKGVVIAAIAHLPEKVAAFAVANCFFFVFQRDQNGQTLPRRQPRRTRRRQTYYIVLLETALERRDGLALVAHEIAHAWLGHASEGILEGSIREGLRDEVAAAQQAADWGFTGRPANPKWMARLFSH